MSVAIHTSQNVTLEYEPASIGDRILATLIDYLVLLAWFTAMLLLLTQAPVLSRGAFWVYVIVLLPLLLYDLLCESFLNGQSLGKIAMKIRVVRLDGSPPGLGAYLIRWLLRLIESPLFMGGLVALITVAVNGRGQRIGDLAAGTTVVKLSRPVSLDQIAHRALPTDHQVTYPEATQLSDRDINVIREALSRRNHELIALTAHKVKQVTGIASEQDDLTFLRTLLNDHQFLATQ